MDPFDYGKRNEISISLMSNANLAHPENTLFKFTNVLAIPLRTPPGERWEIALHSLAVSNLLDQRSVMEQKMKEVSDRAEIPGTEEESQDLTTANVHRTIEKRTNEIDAEVHSPNFWRFIKFNLQRRTPQLRQTTHRITELTKETEALSKQLDEQKDNEALHQLYKRKKASLRTSQRDQRILKAIFVHLYAHRTLLQQREMASAVSPFFLELEEVDSREHIGSKIAVFFANKTKPTSNKDKEDRDKPNNLFTFYTPVNKTFFPLHNNYIPSLSARFCDTHGRTLTGQAANPSIVRLTLRRVDMEADYEYHSCYINSRPSDDPLNFYARLPPFLYESATINEWEMALVKAIVPKEFLHLPEKRYVKLIERPTADGLLNPTPLTEMTLIELKEMIQDVENDRGSATYAGGEEISFNYNPKAIDIITALNYAFRSFEKHATKSVPKYRLKLAITADQKVSMTSNRPLIIVLPITIVAGMTLHERAIYLNDTYCCLEFEDQNPGLPPILSSNEIRPDLSILAEQEERYSLKGGVIDLTVIEPQNLLLHVDCISPTLVGNSYGQYLSNVPLDNKHYAFAEHAPIHPEYHELNTNGLNHVSFKLFHVDGSLPQLYAGDLMKKIYSTTNYRSFFTLSFRRKIKK